MAPRLSSLAIARRQPLLGGASPRVHGRQLPLDLVALGASLRRRRFGPGEAGAMAAQLGGEQRGAQLVGVALDPRVDVGRLRLSLQRAKPATRLALDVERAIQVVLRAL